MNRIQSHLALQVRPHQPAIGVAHVACVALLLGGASLMGCSSDNNMMTTGLGPSSTSQTTAATIKGNEVHVTPGAAATSPADGTEALPFATVSAALAAIAATPNFDGTMIWHAGEHKLPTNVEPGPHVDLKILAGATVKLGPDVSIHAERDVKVLGTEQSPVTFTWLEENKHWSAVTIYEPTSQANVFEYAIFEHGYESQFKGLSTRGALGLYNAAARISHCIFRNNEGDDGLTTKYSDSIVEYSQFLNNVSDAIDDGSDKAEIRFCYFEGNGNDAADLGDATQAYVHDNVMVNNGDKCVSMGEGTLDARVTRNLCVGNGIGVAFKDGSQGLVWNNTLYNNDIGVASYEALAPMGPGKGKFWNNIVWASKTADLNLDPNTETVFAYNCIQKPTEATTGKALTGVGILSPGAGCDDPLFVNPPTPVTGQTDKVDTSKADFHLRSTAGHWNTATKAWVIDDKTSPLLDSGDPTTPIGDEPAPNGGRVELGLYGGTAEASKSP